MAVMTVAWRNLGRNRRRTLLTASAVGFACMLLVFSMSMQGGSYSVMIDNATRMLTGHLQVQDARFRDDPAIRHTVGDLAARLEALLALPEVTHVSPRSMAYAVLSGDQRSFGGQIMGVDPVREGAFSLLPEFIETGTYLSGAPGEIVLGVGLARNLDVGVGDEVVVLGTALDGGIAATASRVVGLLETSQPELDRQLAQIPFDDFAVAFGLDDEAHAIVVVTDDVTRSAALTEMVADAGAPEGEGAARVVGLSWADLIPEMEQMIELDRTTAYFFYVLLGIMVTFSIANTFMMTIFERTREFGTLMALGSRPGFIIGMLQLEAVALCGLGVLGGTLAGMGVTLLVGWIGIPVDEMGAELLRQYHLPERIHPRMTLEAVTWGPVFMLVATQIAALVPALRLQRIEPVAALRVE